MDEQTRNWQPSRDEVEHIREELRPLISRMATRSMDVLTEERWRRSGVVVL